MRTRSPFMLYLKQQITHSWFGHIIFLLLLQNNSHIWAFAILLLLLLLVDKIQKRACKITIIKVLLLAKCILLQHKINMPYLANFTYYIHAFYIHAHPHTLEVNYYRTSRFCNSFILASPDCGIVYHLPASHAFMTFKVFE